MTTAPPGPADDAAAAFELACASSGEPAARLDALTLVRLHAARVLTDTEYVDALREALDLEPIPRAGVLRYGGGGR